MRAARADVVQVCDPRRRARAGVGHGAIGPIGPIGPISPIGFLSPPFKAVAMEWLTPILGGVVPLLLGGAFWLGRLLPRAAAQRSLLSPVTQQHLHLFQGGRLSEAAIATAKVRLGALLARGDLEQAAASLRPGLGFAVQVQALAEIGSPQ